MMMKQEQLDRIQSQMRRLKALPGGFVLGEGEEVDLHGIGTVTVQEMSRDGSAPLDLGL